MTLRITNYAALTGTNKGLWEAIGGFFKNPVTWIVGAIIALIALVIIVAVAARRKKLAADSADKADDESDTKKEAGEAKKADDESDTKKEAGEAKKEAGEAKKEAGEAKKEAGEAKKEAGEAKKEAGEAKKEAGEAKKEAGEAKKEAGEAKKEAGEAKTISNQVEAELQNQKAAKALVDTLPKRERISTALDRVERVIRGEVSKANSLKYQFARTDTSDLAQKDLKVAAYQRAGTFASQMALEFEDAEAALRRATTRGASDEELKALNDNLTASKTAKDAAAKDELEALQALMTLKGSFEDTIKALEERFNLQPSIDKVVAQGEELKKIQKWIDELPAELTGTAELSELTDKMAEVKAINTDVLEELKAKVDRLIADYEAAIDDVERVM